MKPAQIWFNTINPDVWGLLLCDLMPTKGISHSNHHIGDQRVIYLFSVTSFSWADETYAYSPNIGNKDKPNYRYYQNRICWTNEFYWDYLLEYGWGVTYRNRNDLKTMASQTSISIWVTMYKTWEPGSHCTACRQLRTLESVLCRGIRWSKLLPSSPLSSSSFRQLSLVSEFFAICLIYEWLSAAQFVYILGRKA